MNLKDQINQQPVDFFYLCLDEFLEISCPDLQNFYSVSPNKLGITLNQKNSGQLLSHPATLSFIQKTTNISHHQVAIVPFKPSAKIEHFCKTSGWKCISNPAQINRQLEDKIKFSLLCDQFKIKTIQHLVLPFSQESFTLSQQKLGQNLVLQTHFGWAGQSTYFFSDWITASKAIPLDTQVKFMPLIDGTTFLNNCCLTHKGLIQSPPALQYTGISPLTTNPFTTVGRQWPCMASPKIINDIHQLTLDFQNILDQFHYQGFFGLDFFLSNDQVYLLECNPRLTASIGLYTKLETNLNVDSLFIYHLAEFLDLEFDIDDHFSLPIQGSELTLKNQKGQTTKRIQTDFPLSPTSDPTSIPDKFIRELSS